LDWQSFAEMNSKKFALKRFPYALLGLIFLASVVPAQLWYDHWSRSERKPLDTTYNILIEPQPVSASTAKLVNFGFKEFLADYYWLSLIQYYGGGDPYGKYRKMPDLFNNIIELSPKYEAVYQTGLIIMPGEGYVDEAIDFGYKGMDNMPDKWEIPYYTGLVYHIYKKDYVSAAKMFERAAEMPNALPITKYFAGIYYNKADQRETAYNIFKTVYETTKDDYVKDRAKKNMDHLAIYFLLQDAVKYYHDNYKSYPSDLNQLVTKKVLKSIPEDPLTIGFTIDPNTGIVTENKK